ncbi:MAG: hypothetical protein ACKVUS_16565 [Saprospiraceae bacterium]
MNDLLEKIGEALARQKKADRVTLCTQIAPVEEGRFFLFEGDGNRAYAVASQEKVQSGADYLIVHVSEAALQTAFVAVDHCLIKDRDSLSGRRCDVALSWNSILAFLDLKLNTTNIAPGLKTAESFHKQMKSTLEYFQNYLGIPLNTYELRIYIVFPAATITTTMGAERLRFESDIFDIFGLNAEYFLVPDTPSYGLTPELRL